MAKYWPGGVLTVTKGLVGQVEGLQWENSPPLCMVKMP